MPISFIDIAPIRIRICAFTLPGSTTSVTLPPSTAGTTRSRSVIAAKLSSIGFAVVKGWSSSIAMQHLLLCRGLPIYARRVVIPVGTHRFGPANASLSVQTRRGGAAAKAGHDLDLARHRLGGDARGRRGPAVTLAELTADATSLRVRKATGGMQALGDDDKANIHQTIDDEVLKRQDIVFRSTAVESTAAGLSVQGDLTLAGATQPITFDLVVGDDGTLRATALVTQSRWG